MEFIIKINMDNAAFETPEYEIMQRLNVIHDKVRDGVVFGKIMDTNGNACGFWCFAEEDEVVQAAIGVVETYDALTKEDSVLGLSLDDYRGLFEAFGSGAERCQKAVAKEIAMQVGLGG